jgi:hypothetical protein
MPNLLWSRTIREKSKIVFEKCEIVISDGLLRQGMPIEKITTGKVETRLGQDALNDALSLVHNISLLPSIKIAKASSLLCLFLDRLVVVDGIALCLRC